MSEQSPEKAKAAGRSDEPEVEGHTTRRNEDPSVIAALSEERDGGDDPEVEGHFKAMKAADPSFKAKQA